MRGPAGGCAGAASAPAAREYPFLIGLRALEGLHARGAGLEESVTAASFASAACAWLWGCSSRLPRRRARRLLVRVFVDRCELLAEPVDEVARGPERGLRGRPAACLLVPCGGQRCPRRIELVERAPRLRQLVAHRVGALHGLMQLGPERVRLRLRVLQLNAERVLVSRLRLQLRGQIVLHPAGGVRHVPGRLLGGNGGRGGQVVHERSDVVVDSRRGVQRRVERLRRRLERRAQTLELLPRGLGRSGKRELIERVVSFAAYWRKSIALAEGSPTLQRQGRHAS